MDKMNIKIDEEIIQMTTNCGLDLRCLSGDKTCLCDVVISNEDDIVKIKSKPAISCMYCIFLDSASYFHCPTRVAIYKHYSK